MKSEDYRKFAAFLAMKGQTENTERDLFAWLLDKEMSTHYKDLWVCTEDKALRDSFEKKAFDLSVIRWKGTKSTQIREHIMEFKSERHGKFRTNGAVNNFLSNQVFPDIYKMRRHFEREGGRKDGTKYWQLQIFYSFFPRESSIPPKYATYSENERSSSKGVSVKPKEINEYCERNIRNLVTELHDNVKNMAGRRFYDKNKESNPKKVKFAVDIDQCFGSQITTGEHRGIGIRTDLYLTRIDFDID